VGWGGGVLTKAERAARVHNKAERAAQFHFDIHNFQNSSLAQPSAQRESENTLGVDRVAPLSLTGRPLFQLTAPAPCNKGPSRELEQRT